MKNILAGSLLAMSLCGCAHKTTFQMVKPLPAISLENIKDATLPAEFSDKDFDWMGGNLRLTVYSEDLYDAVQISQLKVGDTIVYDGKPIVAKKIENKNKYLVINDGIEEGGAELTANQGGIYRGSQMDDHSTYTKVGQVQLPLTENFTIIDCGENPTDPSDTIRTAQKLYLENLKDYKRQFNCLDTRVRVENGMITNITRHWIP